MKKLAKGGMLKNMMRGMAGGRRRRVRPLKLKIGCGPLFGCSGVQELTIISGLGIARLKQRW